MARADDPDELRTLLDGGDWACAQGDEEALERVAHALVWRLEPPLRSLATLVADLAERDLEASTELWGWLAETLRGRERPPAPLRA